MTWDVERLKQTAPLVVPVVIVALGWYVLIRPTAGESAQVGQELEGLRQRIAMVRASAGPPPPDAPAADPVKAFERQVAVGDPSGSLLEELSRLAANTNVRVEALETGEPGTISGPGGPVVAGGAMPDPRFALFQTALTYLPVTLRAESDYKSLGEFLWRLRDLATVVEIRSVEIVAPEAAANAPAAPAGTVRITLSLFAYSRAGARREDPA